MSSALPPSPPGEVNVEPPPNNLNASESVTDAHATDGTVRKSPPSHPKPSHRFSTTPHFDLASSSSTAYIALPPPSTEMGTSEDEQQSPRGAMSSFFHRNLGLFLIAGAQMFFSIMNLCAKLLTSGDPPIHPLEIIFMRMVITWFGAILYLHYNKIPDYLFGPKEVRLLLVNRGVFGFFGLFGIYYSLKYLDLSDATVLTFLAPILTGYFGRIFLKEPFLRTELFAGLISMFGVILIARPQSLFGTSEIPGQASGLQRLAAVGVALLGVVGAAGAYISIRAIGSRAHPLISVSLFSLYATVVSTIAIIALQIPFHYPRTFLGWFEWVIIGVSGFAAQFLLTAGLQRERAGRGTTMVYLQMVFAFGFEKLVWGTSPDFWSVSGSGLILGSAIWVAVAKAKIKHESGDDIERGAYVAVNSHEEQYSKFHEEEEFELEDLGEEDGEGNASGSLSTSAPATPTTLTRRHSDAGSDNFQIPHGEMEGAKRREEVNI